MNQFELTDEQFNELLRLCRLYRREADGCMEAKAYLAGCIMIGAALEASLTAMCHCYSGEIQSRLIPKTKGGKPKHLLKWSLFQLLTVARESGWVPACLSIDDEWNGRKADVGDWIVVVQQIRNLVHPARYLTDFSGSQMTKHRMEMCFDILEATIDCFSERLGASLKTAVEAENDEELADGSAEDGECMS